MDERWYGEVQIFAIGIEMIYSRESRYIRYIIDYQRVNPLHR
jgi:hypothetical protein